MNVMLLGIVLLLAPPAGSSASQSAPAPAAQAQSEPDLSVSGRPTSHAYILGPDDGISIRVLNYDKFDIPEMVIPPDGRVKFQLLDPPIMVAGKTTEELGQLLTQKWSDYVKNITVTVTLIHKRPHEGISVFGYAAKSATIEYRPNLRLYDVIASVGGAGAEGDLSRLVLTHRDGQSLTLDLSHPETKANSAVNLPMLEGDTIFIPQKHQQVTVTGEVEKPGDVDYHEEMRILEAINAVGGVHTDTADLASAQYTHNGNTVTINLEALLKRGEFDKNLKLYPGDSLNIPEIRNRTYVFGEVGHPGWYNFKPGDRLLDTLTAQGGPTQDADMRRILVITIDKNKNVSKVQPCNLDAFLHGKDSTQNILIKAGDVVFVPERKRPFSSQNLFSMLLGLNLVRSVGSIATGGFF